MFYVDLNNYLLFFELTLLTAPNLSHKKYHRLHVKTLKLFLVLLLWLYLEVLAVVLVERLLVFLFQQLPLFVELPLQGTCFA